MFKKSLVRRVVTAVAVTAAIAVPVVAAQSATAAPKHSVAQWWCYCNKGVI